MQPVDVVAALLRILGFIAAFQAAGMALFLAAHSRQPLVSSAAVRILGARAALCAIFLVFAHYSLEAARMAGEFAGLLDGGLQRFAWTTSAGVAAGVRMFGLLVLFLFIRRETTAGRALSVAGAALALVSFAATGHTAHHPIRALLAPLLILHVLIVAYWFGGIAGLHLAARRDAQAALAAAAKAFSRVAEWLVPLILAAGVLMAALLAPDLSVLRQPYGILLLIKLTGYVLLIALAVRNRNHLVPAVDRGEVPAVAAFRSALLAEYLLVVAVLAATAVMTGFFSPE